MVWKYFSIETRFGKIEKLVKINHIRNQIANDFHVRVIYLKTFINIVSKKIASITFSYKLETLFYFQVYDI